MRSGDTRLQGDLMTGEVRNVLYWMYTCKGANVMFTPLSLFQWNIWKGHICWLVRKWGSSATYFAVFSTDMLLDLTLTWLQFGLIINKNAGFSCNYFLLFRWILHFLIAKFWVISELCPTGNSVEARNKEAQGNRYIKQEESPIAISNQQAL